MEDKMENGQIENENGGVVKEENENIETASDKSETDSQSPDNEKTSVESSIIAKDFEKIQTNVDSHLSHIEQNIGDLSKGVKEDVKILFDSMISTLVKSNDETNSNLKELILRLDAINETVSILPETNDHIKSVQTNSSDSLGHMDNRFDSINDLLSKAFTEITVKLNEQKDTIVTIYNGVNEYNNVMLQKFDTFFSNIEKLTVKISDIANYEYQINDKREKEFALMQAKLYNDRGQILFYRGIFTSALNYFSKAEELDSSSPEIHNNIGQTLVKMKNFTKAEESFKKAIEIFPDFSEAYNNLGLMYLDNSNYELAIETFKKSISLYPDFSDAYFNIGNTYHSLNKIDEAIKNWEKALEINPFMDEAKEKLKIYKKGEINV